MARAERLALRERAHAEWTLVVQTELLSLKRTSLYYQPVGPGVEEVALKHRIDEV